MDSGKEQILREKALAWDDFVNSGKIKQEIIASQIAASWIKCANSGVNPSNGKGHIILENHALLELMEKNETIINTAKPLMQNLYKFFRGSSFVVVLTDAQGYILELFGDYDRLQSAQKLNFLPGAKWKEDDVGTNAIGTVLSMGNPIQVSGAEHFCRQHHCWTCSAAPIMDEYGKIAAVLDISGPANSSYSHTLGMVVAAAAAITMQLKMLRKNKELTLANKRLTSIFNTMSEGVILIDRTGVIHEVNPVASRMLEKSSEEVVGHSIEAILGGKTPHTRRMLSISEPYCDVELMVPHKNGTSHCLISGEPITDEQGNPGGGVIILRPIKQVKSLVNRFSGHFTAFQFSDIIGNSPAIREAVRVASLTAATMSNILLQGESGTGKELFAQAIHHGSARRGGPYIALNCGAIPRELIGSELFGYEGGAFTGARREGRPGKFELASGGTLFLDEIGDMPLEHQVALLRVIQEKTITRIGSSRVVSTDVRLICATNKDLAKEVERGAFRQDLYYRLNVIAITAPPLRERGEDILLLFNHFLNSIGKKQGVQFVVDPEVLDFLPQYHWPGNVRELHNLVERAASLAEGNRISLHHFPPELCSLQKPLRSLATANFNKKLNIVSLREQTRQQIEQNERKSIIDLLNECGGNISVVAKRLRVARSTIYRKMRSYDQPADIP
ncbi:MAG: sigma-54-dependent Fis family transcriptional regulator [Negativicutes bacterium]